MADLVRWFMIVEALVLAGVAIAVLQEARSFRAPGGHVYLISASYIGFVAWGVVEVHGRMGEPLSWRPFWGLFVLTLGVAAMTVLFLHYRPSRRRRRHGRKSELAAERLKREAGF